MSESFYIDRLSNAGTEINVAGQTMRVYQMTLRDQGVLQATIRAIQPNPIVLGKQLLTEIGLPITLENLREERKAAAFWPATVASNDGMQVLFNDEVGQRTLLQRALRINESQASQLMDVLTLKDFVRIATTAISGIDPETVVEDEGESDPKVEATQLSQ